MATKNPNIHLCMTKYEAIQFLREKDEAGFSLIEKCLRGKSSSKHDIRQMFEEVSFQLSFRFSEIQCQKSCQIYQDSAKKKISESFESKRSQKIVEKVVQKVPKVVSWKALKVTFLQISTSKISKISLKKLAFSNKQRLHEPQSLRKSAGLIGHSVEITEFFCHSVLRAINFGKSSLIIRH